MVETIDLIKNGIKQKLDAAKKMINYDKEIAMVSMCMHWKNWENWKYRKMLLIHT